MKVAWETGSIYKGGDQTAICLKLNFIYLFFSKKRNSNPTTEKTTGRKFNTINNKDWRRRTKRTNENNGQGPTKLTLSFGKKLMLRQSMKQNRNMTTGHPEAQTKIINTVSSNSSPG